MLALPGSLLWLFLLVYLASGQNLDNSSLDRLDTSSQTQGEFVGNHSRIQNDEEEKEKVELGVGESVKKTPQLYLNESSTSSSANKTSSSFSDKLQALNETTSGGRNSRRHSTSRPTTALNTTEIPKMSQERRNSYLSIAERRKYYNRTRIQTKKSQPHEVELEYQETTNRLVTSSTEAPLVNEIRVVKKPVTKDPDKEMVTEKNPTNNQRIFVSSRSNETHGKPQSTRQSVIQSQYQFGQKLNLRKSGSRVQEAQDDRLRKKKEKSRMEFIMENSTNKLIKNYPTQSTKLIKVDKSLWMTTTTPQADADHENLVMLSFGNGTVLEKLVRYITANNTEKSFSNRTSAGEGAEDNNQTSALRPQTTFNPLPLSNLNATEEDGHRKYISAVEGTTSKLTQNFLAKPVFKLNNSVLAVPKQTFTPTNVPLHSTIIMSVTETTTLFKPLTNATEKPKTTKVRNGKFSNYNITSPTVKEPNSSLEWHRNTTPFVKAISRNPDWTSTTRFAQSEVNISTRPTPQTEAKKKVQILHAVPGAENISKAEDYPLTIELNENNKRVLSEMFQTITTSEPKRATKGETTTSQPKVHVVSKNESSTTTSSTALPTTSSAPSSAEVTTKGLQVLPPDEYPEDHKAQGTRYNTKFYIAPNLNKSQVIKVVEEEEIEEDDDKDGRSRYAGAAIYVLAAFGLIPLLLALVFGTKFVMQRNQRQYECESDAKSDISANEGQVKESRRKKGSTDLKKSPSNVTTITLVTATRLPRVQHWETSEKQGNRNWEFPRSKLKLKTILGQGNFGQVWKAEAEDMMGHEGVTRLVAVKTVKEGAAEKEHTEFIKELEIMQQIGSHPNIVTLLGCCTDQEPYYLIMEYVKFGKLLTYLREHRVNENYYNFSNNSDALTSRDLTVFAYCVARGMEYLASRGIIHRDLAARNVLVDHNKLCKIADFGMSRSVRDFENGQVYEERQQKGALPIRWMAPESLVYSVFTHKSDVWSFGIVMWEIVTLGSTPYPNMGAREVMRKVRDGYRLERPSHCKAEFYRLISHCWAHDPNKRPDFSELRQELSCLLDNPTKDGSYVDLDRFAIDNSFHVSSKTNDFRLLERTDFKTLQKFGDWDNKDWPEDTKKMRTKRGKNNGKGTVMLTGQGSFTMLGLGALTLCIVPAVVTFRQHVGHCSSADVAEVEALRADIHDLTSCIAPAYITALL